MIATARHRNDSDRMFCYRILNLITSRLNC